MVTIKVEDLVNMAKELEKSGIRFVEVDILEEDEFEGEVMPAMLHFMGLDGYGGGVDFGVIDEVEANVFYRAEEELDEE